MSPDHASRALARLSILLWLCLAPALLPACAGCDETLDPDDAGVDALADLDLAQGDMASDIADLSPIEDLTDRPDLAQADMPADLPEIGPDPQDMRTTRPLDLAGFDFGPEPDSPPDHLSVDALLPDRGPIAGKTPFVVTGAGFSAESAIFFGSRQAEVELVDGVLVGQTPAGAGPGPVTVRVVDPALGTVSLPEGFTYIPDLFLSRATPDTLPTTGLIEVELHGGGFDAETRVSFGGVSALRHTLVDPSLMRVIAPPHAPGVVDLRATNRDGSVTLPEAITYFESLRLDQLEPASGPLSGGTSVELTGQGFTPDMTASFGPTPAAVISVAADGKSARVNAPASGSAGLVDVSLVLPSGEATLREDAFLYTDSASLQLAALSPRVGPLSGGQTVRLIGAALEQPNLQVFFGANLATVVSRQPSHLTVTTPPGASAGAVDVRVGTETLSGAYTYVPVLGLSQIAPSAGSVSGNDTVTLTGSGFTDAESVRFGGLSATSFTIDSDTRITATSPAHAAGAVDVVVARDGLEARLVDGFLYQEQGALYGFSPVRGSVAGNTYVVLRGRGFTPGLRVFFGQLEAPEVDVLDAQTVAARTPPAMVPGSVPVSIITAQGDTLDASQPYLYFNPGARFGGAWGGSVQGAVNVTVYSQGGGPIENAFVMLSTRPDTAYQGFTDVNGMLTLSGPEVYGEQTISAVAAGFSSATVQRVDAENITLFLSPPPSQGNPPAGPLPATFYGRLTGLNKIAETTPTQYPIAFVYTTQRDPGSPNPDPGSQNVLLADGDYSLISRLGDLSLVAVGGLYDNATQRFTPLRLGVARYQFASEGMSYNVDIDLNIVLDQQLTIKLNNAPPAPNQHQVQTFMDFGFEGVFGGLGNVQAASSQNIIPVEHLPALTGVLADVTLDIEAGAYTNGSAPYSVGLLRDLDQLNRIYDVNLLAIPAMTSPIEGGTPLNGLVSFDYASASRPNLFFVRLQTFDQQTRWEAFLPGTATSVRLPTFPDFSSLPPDQRPAPYGNELLVLLIIGIEQPGLDFNNFSYNDLDQERWTAFSLSVHTLQL